MGGFIIRFGWSLLYRLGDRFLRNRKFELVWVSVEEVGNEWYVFFRVIYLY